MDIPVSLIDISLDCYRPTGRGDHIHIFSENEWTLNFVLPCRSSASHLAHTLAMLDCAIIISGRLYYIKNIFKFSFLTSQSYTCLKL